MIYLLIGYMWLFIHRPWEEWPWLAAYRPERTFMILILVCWVLSGPQVRRWNRLHTYFAVFVAVVLLSWLTSPYPNAGWPVVENYLKYVVFYVLLVTTVRDERDLRKIMTAFVGVMGLFMAHSMREWFNGRVRFAQNIPRMVGIGETFSNSNDFAGLIVMSLPFAWLLWQEAETRWRQLGVAGYFALAFFCLVRTGSRMGFVGMLLFGFLVAMLSPGRWRLLALAPLVLASAWMVMPEQYQNRFLTLVDPSRGPASAEASAGNYRYGGFETGLRLAAQRPVLGYGPGGVVATQGGGHQTHNTYGQILAELGYVGAVAFALLVFGIVKNMLEASGERPYLAAGQDTFAWRTVVASTMAFVVLMFMGWGLHFLFWHVWLWFGAFQVLALTTLHDQTDAAEAQRAAEWAMPYHHDPESVLQ